MGFSGLKMYFFRNTCIQTINFIRPQSYKWIFNKQNPSMDIQINLSSQKRKTDGVFYHAFQKVSFNATTAAIVQLVKLIVFIILIPINLLTQNIEYGNLIKCFIINSVASGVGLLFQLSLICCVVRSVQVFLNLAEQTNHLVYDQLVTNISSKQSCVSNNIYIAQNQVKYQNVNELQKQNHIKVTKNTINAIIRTSFPWLKNFQDLYSIFSFGTMIYSIYVLAKEDQPPFDTVLLAFYVVIVAFTQLPLVVVCIFIALSPFICLCFLIFCCCCSGDDHSGQFIDISSRQATTNDLVNSGGDCSICMMSISKDSKILVLPCSQKHVFHVICLKQWARVKNTCPICRAQIPMTSLERESQRESNQPEGISQE